MSLSNGASFDRYEILSPLGVGGMGEVYLARDTKLERKVALKVLPSNYTHDADRVRRFEQEAKAASALNHPNIITIFEVGEIEGAHFIVMEFIEGQTLRKRLRQRTMKVSEAIEVAIQIASALSTAHTAGILHRDIKPENIMLRPDGYVKILDFGLAKLTERQNRSEDFSAFELNETDPGIILGTATYMSPEQARALKVDARSDIFSLGIVLYEMIAGRSPFYDQTASDVISAILHREPLPLSRYSREVTPEIERIIHKALKKDREQRYQSAQDLLSDLRDVWQNNPFQPRSGNNTSSADQRTTVIGHTLPDLETRIEFPATETYFPSPQTHSSAKIIISEIKKHKIAALLVLLSFIAIVGAISFGFYKLFASRAGNYTNMTLTRLPTEGRIIDAALSPDGKYVAYVIDDGEQQGLRVKQVSPYSNSLQLVAPADVRFRAPTFSRDGNYVFYVVRSINDSAGDLYRMPTLGGATRKIISGVSSPISVSPDGDRVVYVREMPSQGESALIIYDTDSGVEQDLARLRFPESFSVDGPSWSPDGKVIACSVASLTSGVNQRVVTVRISDGKVKPVSDQQWLNIGRIAWLPDGEGLLMPARVPNSHTRQILILGYPDGKVRRVTNDLNDYRGLTITDDGSRLVTVQITQLSNLWVAPANDLSRPRKVTSGARSNDGVLGMAWTLDGKIIYASNASGKSDLWMMNVDGSQQRQLTTDASNNYFPSVSSDGRFIFFNSDRSGKVGVWRMDMDGNNLNQLTFGQHDLDPQFSREGGWVVFSSIKSGKRTLWKVPVDGGEPVQVIDRLSEFPVISPDGKLIACASRDENSDIPGKILVIPFDGNDPTHTFDIPTTPWRLVRFAPDNKALNYVETRNGASNIWSQPLAGGQPRQLTDFPSDRISAFAWSLDGKQLACARGSDTREIVLIRNFR